MLFSETSFEDCIPIQGYGVNSFNINDDIYVGGIFLFSNIVSKWAGFQDFSFLENDIIDMEILFIGTGVENQKLNKKFNDFLIKKNISIECFNTPTACRAFNITISSQRKAGALLMPI